MWVAEVVFGWTMQSFPFSVKTAHALKIREQHVITVTGKAFYDIAYAPADHSNRRRKPVGVGAASQPWILAGE
jgi:hypothetical protein